MYKPNFEVLDRLTEEGYLRKVVSDCKQFVIYNYTDHCTYDKHWNKHTINSRGTVYRKSDGKIMALAFPKFFNFSELPTSKSRNLLKKTDFTSFEKMDGSLGVVWHDDEKWRVTTRGSFESDQAQEATRWLYDDKKHMRLALMAPTHITLLCEIIYPANKIIVDYGDKAELVLLGAFDRNTGKELNEEELDALAKSCGLSQAPKLEFETVQDMIDMQSIWDKNEEGVVAKFGNERVKFKGLEYLKIAKIYSDALLYPFGELWKKGKYQFTF